MNPECDCGGDTVWSRYCGAHICERCDRHVGMVRCYCGWAESGGDGYAELVEAGETIEPDDY
jgi:hypothetical protein